MKTKVTGYLTQKHGFYYVVLNLPTDEKRKAKPQNAEYRVVH